MYQMPREREGDDDVAGHRADDPDDHDRFKLLELYELWDEVDGGCSTDAADCARVSQRRG